MNRPKWNSNRGLISMTALLLTISCGKTNNRHSDDSDAVKHPQLTGGNLPSNGQTFVPKFGEYVPLSFKIPSGFTKSEKIEMTDIQVTGGTFRTAICDSEVCSIEILYNNNTLAPSLKFALSAPGIPQSVFNISAEPEHISALSPERVLIMGSSQITLTVGVDYSSSWNRPVPGITVTSQPVPGYVTFQCTIQTCVSNTLMTNSESPIMMKWKPQSYLSDPVEITSQFKVIKANITPQISEVIVDGGKGTDIVWRPGKEYVANAGALAERLYINSSSNGVLINGTNCDLQGVCRMHVEYRGTDAFYTAQYSLTRSNENVPSHTLKIMPSVQMISRQKILWINDSGWQDLVIRTGDDGDYFEKNGEKAELISLRNADDLIFKDIESVTDGNRDSIFHCDNKGTCVATAKRKYKFIDSLSIDVQIKTKNHTGARTTLNYTYKRDVLSLTKDRIILVGAKHEGILEKFSLVLKQGTDLGYTSIFPASRIIVDASEEGIVLDKAMIKAGTSWESACDLKGECRVEGEFLPDDFGKQFTFHIVNDWGTSAGQIVQLASADRSAFVPSKDEKIAVGESIDNAFKIVITRNTASGYVSDKPAKKIRIVSTSGFSVLNAQPIAAENGTSVYDLNCDEEGTCTIKIKAENYNPQIQYYLIGENGVRGPTTKAYLQMPSLFAGPNYMIVAADTKMVMIRTPNSSRKISHMVFPGLNDESISCNIYQCEGEISLKEPVSLDSDQTLEYFFVADSKKSNIGQLTLSGGKSYAMKPDLEIEAEMLDAKLFKISIDSSSFGIENDPMLIKLIGYGLLLDLPHDLIIIKTECSTLTAKCVFTMRSDSDAPTKTLELKVLAKNFASAFIIESPFKVILK